MDTRVLETLFLFLECLQEHDESWGRFPVSQQWGYTMTRGRLILECRRFCGRLLNLYGDLVTNGQCLLSQGIGYFLQPASLPQWGHTRVHFVFFHQYFCMGDTYRCLVVKPKLQDLFSSSLWTYLECWWTLHWSWFACPLH